MYDPLRDHLRVEIPFVLAERAIMFPALAAARLPRSARRAILRVLRSYTEGSDEEICPEGAVARRLQSAARWLLAAPQSAPETTEPAAPPSEELRAKHAAVVARLEAAFAQPRPGEGTDHTDHPSRPEGRHTSAGVHRMASGQEDHPQPQGRRRDDLTGQCCACERPSAESPAGYRGGGAAGKRRLPDGWWIWPVALVGVAIWIGVFKLIGVL